MCIKDDLVVPTWIMSDMTVEDFPRLPDVVFASFPGPVNMRSPLSVWAQRLLSGASCLTNGRLPTLPSLHSTLIRNCSAACPNPRFDSC